MKINIILRTCDKINLQSNRIYNKKEVIVRCLKSLVESCEIYGNYSLIIFDDNSSIETKQAIEFLAPKAKIFFNEHDKGKRHTVKLAYDYVLEKIPKDQLVYMVEDDYMHYPESITKMIEAWEYFSNHINTEIGIFPQDFLQLYWYPDNKFSDVYCKPCTVLIGPDRYYRTTWYTHESFMIKSKVIHNHIEEFKKLELISIVDGMWEGNTISKVWGIINMLMPMTALAIHVSLKQDIPFYVKDFENLWKRNEYLWSEQDLPAPQ